MVKEEVFGSNGNKILMLTDMLSIGENRLINYMEALWFMVKTNTSSQEQTEQTLIIFKLRLLMRTESLKEQRL